MRKTILERYAQLLVNYSLYLKKGETLFIRTSTVAEPLVKEIYREATRKGAHVEVFFDFQGKAKIFNQEASEEQLKRVSPLTEYAYNNFDAYLYIIAEYNLTSMQNADQAKQKIQQEANKAISQVYSKRTAEGSMKRSLCLYPTNASAQAAGMSLEEYEDFVFGACHLFADDPEAEWLKIREHQQGKVDYLNKVATVRYVNPKSDISFSVDGRTWINSDGCNNMPSGEVFSSPVEDSVNGHIYFDYPSYYQGHEVQGILLEVKDGQVIKWNADKGQEFLNKIFDIPGSRYFGEVAIGTNYGIQTPTKNILFDEKIGGTIHMAIGQSYLQTGGKNESSVHWDMIADMKHGGQIFADGTLIYENGQFLI